MLESLRAKGFEILALHHAEAILTLDMPQAVEELEAVLSGIDLPVEELVRGGGGEGQLTQRMRHALANLGWVKHNFEVKKIVDGQEKESISHEVDHVKYFHAGVFALEIEWNNKDPFFDRDLEYPFSPPSLSPPKWAVIQAVGSGSGGAENPARRRRTASAR